MDHQNDYKTNYRDRNLILKEYKYNFF